ncbi:MAG: response regulator [Candidatus Omnitrophica bacterium]|nr:response regulator [Candidatus Omnitrophota bacterium]
MDIPNVLIVDDEFETRNTLRMFLSGRIECNVYEAGNGSEALDILKSVKCDVMILDVRMPEKNGISVLDEMNDICEQNVDTILITAWNSAIVELECEKRKIECVQKPVVLSQLFKKVATKLKKRDKFIPLSID